METKPTYEELAQRVKELEEETIRRSKVEGELGASEARLADALRTRAERKRTEQTLQEGEERLLSDIFASIQDGITILDKELNIIRVNPTMERWYSHAMPLTGKKCYEAYHGLSDVCGVCPTRLTLTTGQIAQEVVPRRGATGDITGWLDLHAVPLVDAATGKLKGVIEYARDITERRRTEEALQERERFLSDIFASIQDGISILDRELNIIRVNPTMERWYSHAMPLTDKKCYEAYHGRSDACEVCPTRQTLMTGRDAYEIVPKTGPGGRIEGWLDLFSFPFFDTATGEIEGVIEYVRDVTEQKRAEEEAKIREQQLVQADKMVSLGTLVAGVAHEINNPNSFVMMNVPILERVWKSVQPILDEYHRENGDFALGGLDYTEMRDHVPSLLSEMKRGCDRIKNIVDDLRDFAQQRPADLTETIDINSVLKSAVTLTSDAIKKSTRNLSENYAEALPPVKGNPQRIEQVMLNLILNACQALPDKDKGVFLSTSYDDEAQAVVVEIRDEGAGIAREDLKRIADPFFTTKRETGGTGLGLSVSAGIVKDHKGRLDFSSTPGVGTTATLILPVVREAEKGVS